jgi:hypothetical protein
MGPPYFIHLKWLILPFITLNGAKHSDIISRHHGGICETNCSQKCSKLWVPTVKHRFWNLIGSPPVLCGTERDWGCWTDSHVSPKRTPVLFRSSPPAGSQLVIHRMNTAQGPCSDRDPVVTIHSVLWCSRSGSLVRTLWLSIRRKKRDKISRARNMSGKVPTTVSTKNRVKCDVWCHICP